MNTPERAGPPAADGPRFPAQRAFVVQFDTKASPAAQRFSGRVEHIVSGHVTDFSSLAQLTTALAAFSGPAGMSDAVTDP